MRVQKILTLQDERLCKILADPESDEWGSGTIELLARSLAHALIKLERRHLLTTLAQRVGIPVRKTK